MRKPEGFSLIELLIVVAIILIIAAIAIPNLLRARIAANEASAVSSIRTIVGAEATYQLAYPTVGFADTLAQLGPGGAGSTCSGPTQTRGLPDGQPALQRHFHQLCQKRILLRPGGCNRRIRGGQLHCGCIRVRLQLHRRARLLLR